MAGVPLSGVVFCGLYLPLVLPHVGAGGCGLISGPILQQYYASFVDVNGFIYRRP